MATPGIVSVLKVLLLVLTSTICTQACRCVRPTLLSSFENSEAALKANGIQEVPSPSLDLRYFSAAVGTVYKGCDLTGNIAIRTGSSTAACGVNLGGTTSYLLFGSLSDETNVPGFATSSEEVLVFTIYSCQYNKQWKELSYWDRFLLQWLHTSSNVICQEKCNVKDCGPPSLAPNFECPDGETVSGPTGVCAYSEKIGACSWGVNTCPTCTSDQECNNKGQFCSNGECRKDGTCGDLRDCQNPANDFTIPKRCLWYLTCTYDGMCDGICGSTCPPSKTKPTNCLKQPCAVPNGCEEKYASCVDDYCGGCNAIFFDAKGGPVCEY